MGACCAFRPSDIGEDFVSSVLSDNKFKLNSIKYESILNIIADIREDKNRIAKRNIEMEKLSTFYDEKENKNVVYHREIIRSVLRHLQEVGSIYEFVFYLYPFLNHKSEKFQEKFYEVLSHKNEGEKLTYKTFKMWMKKYVEFCTQEITTVFIQHTEDVLVKKALTDLLAHVYNMDNIETEVNYLLDGLVANPKDDTPVELNKRFYSHFEERKFASFYQVRDKFLMKYASK
jgi:hypothetical protein